MLAGAGRAFMAGGDLAAFQASDEPPALAAFIDKRKPRFTSAEETLRCST
ncbi:MAG TPA: hypothetical protein VLI72_11400 [Methylibium sp.]|nr:hypothetical protein [Methylibium sp.]